MPWYQAEVGGSPRLKLLPLIFKKPSVDATAIKLRDLRHRMHLLFPKDSQGSVDRFAFPPCIVWSAQMSARGAWPTYSTWMPHVAPPRAASGSASTVPMQAWTVGAVSPSTLTAPSRMRAVALFALEPLRPQAREIFNQSLVRAPLDYACRRMLLAAYPAPLLPPWFSFDWPFPVHYFYSRDSLLVSSSCGRLSPPARLFHSRVSCLTPLM